MEIPVFAEGTRELPESGGAVSDGWKAARKVVG